MTSKVTVEAHCSAETLVVVQQDGQTLFLRDGAKKEFTIYDDRIVIAREVALSDAQAVYGYCGEAIESAPAPAK